MKYRKTKKVFKNNGNFLWNHDQVRFIRLNSQIFLHPYYNNPKFPHRKWAEAQYQGKSVPPELSITEEDIKAIEESYKNND